MKNWCATHRGDWDPVECDAEGCSRMAVVSEEEGTDILPRQVEELEAYRDSGRALGGFLEAVVRNDLIDTANRATEDNTPRILGIARWVYYNLPMGSCRSREAYVKWIHQCGLKGVEANGEAEEERG